MKPSDKSRTSPLHPTELFMLMRPRHWVKNAFIFSPLLFTSLYLTYSGIVNTLITTILFCLAASVVYVVNDIVDAEADRNHPTKKDRPIAAGTVSPAQARILAVLCASLLAIGLYLFPPVAHVVLAYLVLNAAYSFLLKKFPIIDITCIATGFVLRVHAGAVAIDVPLSFWMGATTFFLAFYLAAIKRRQELQHCGSGNRKALGLYSVGILNAMISVGALGAIVFYCWTIVKVHPALLYTPILVVAGLARYCYIAVVKNMGESPTEALLTDPWLLGIVATWGGACALLLLPGS